MTLSLPEGRLGTGAYVPAWPGPALDKPGWADLRQAAIDLEAIGIDTIWAADEPGFWEPWSILPALATATKRVELGPLVLCTAYRAPAMVASMAEGLDEVSGGRLIVGLGAGVGPSDARWAKLGYDSEKHIGRFAEAVEVTTRLLRETQPVEHDGAFYHLAGARLKPRGPRPDGPPVWVAAGKPRTLSVAARFGDAINWTSNFTDAASVRDALAAVRTACEAVGRDPASLPLTGCVRLELEAGASAVPEGTIPGDDVQVIATLQEMHAAGLRHVTIFTGDAGDTNAFPALTPEAIDQLAPIIEALRA